MQVVVVGGGFGGVKAALELSKRKVGKITLISDESYFLHHATLYATATGRNLAESVIPLEAIFANHPNVTIVNDKIRHLDEHRRTIIGKKGQYKYSQLVLALGSVTTFFGIKGVKEHAFGIKTLDEVKDFQNHIHDEVVEKKLDKEYFVIGGGPTGVELAAALNEYLQSLVKLYRISGARSKVTLIEAAPRILPRMSKTASRKVTKQLISLGIRVKVNHKVEALNDDSIIVDGKEYPTTTAVWTSGVANNPFFKRHDDIFTLAPNGRVVVNPYLEATAGIYVVGDNNTVKHSGMAWPALKQATHAADQIARLKNKRNRHHYRSYSVPAGVPVGESWAYVEWHGMYVSGRFGALVRRLMELYGYCQLVSLRTALPIWRAHDLQHVDE